MSLDWHSVDTVLLDMDGTLLDLHFDNHFWLEYVPEKYAEKHGISLNLAKKELMPRFNSKVGQLDWYCLDYWGKELELDIQALKRELQHLIALRPGVETFLKAIRAAGKRVVMITNAHPGSLSLKMETINLEPYFDRLISSHHYGYPKETPAFWDALHADIGLDPARSLFIDDSCSILQSAKDYGIRHNLSIVQPDLRKQPRGEQEFEAIEHFEDLLPVPA
ncbi:GMP/IMP nucleotidase [Spongorhabdus nitratireducens]